MSVFCTGVGGERRQMPHKYPNYEGGSVVKKEKKEKKEEKQKWAPGL